MNRRQMLALSTGFALGGIVPATAQETESPLWFINNEELNTTIVLPKTKNQKAIESNRLTTTFGRRDEALIRKAEAVYPRINYGRLTDDGKFTWYDLDAKDRTPTNVTPRAVNYWFDLATNNKGSFAKYNVEIDELFAVVVEKEERKNASGTIETLHHPNYKLVYEVSLSLSYGIYCGKLCGGGFDRRKKVFFNEKEEIIALYMPTTDVWMS